MVTPSEQLEPRVTPTTSEDAGDYTDFRDVWQQVFHRAVDALARRGIERSAAEDAVQEAGARAFTRAVPFASADDLGRWVNTVAWRLAVDEHRRHGRRRADLVAVDDSTGTDDVAAVVEGRIAWEAALSAWSRLSPADRVALTVHEQTGDRRAAVRNAVRRHRARARLVAYIEAATAAVAFLLGRARRTAPAVAAAALPVLGLAVLWLPDGRDSNGSRSGDAGLTGPVAQLGSTRPAPIDARDPATTGSTAGGTTASVPQATPTAEIDHVVGWPRPKEGDEPVLCAGTTNLTACVEPPAQPKLSDLDEPVDHLPSPSELLPRN